MSGNNGHQPKIDTTQPHARIDALIRVLDTLHRCREELVRFHFDRTDRFLLIQVDQLTRALDQTGEQMFRETMERRAP